MAGRAGLALRLRDLYRGKRTLQLQEFWALTEAGLPGTEFRDPGRLCQLGAVTAAAVNGARSQKRYLSSPPPRSLGVLKPTVPSLASPRKTSRRRRPENPVPRRRGPRSPGPLSSNRWPSLTHLMLFHHFAEARVTLRHPSVKLGDAHLHCQHLTPPKRNQTPRRALRRPRRRRPSLC